MQIQIVVIPIQGGGFRAQCDEPLSLTAEGATQEEAVQRLKELIQSRLAAGGTPNDAPDP